MVGANREVCASPRGAERRAAASARVREGVVRHTDLTVSRVLCELESSVQMLIITHLGPGRSENQKGNIEKEFFLFVCFVCF